MRIPSGLIMIIVLILVIFGISTLFYKTNKNVNFESKKEITYTNLSVDKIDVDLRETGTYILKIDSMEFLIHKTSNSTSMVQIK
jgi:hypothetical protein